MHRIRRFVLLLGGVLVPRISTVVQQISVNETLDPLRLHQLENQLTLGQITLESFCAELASMTPDTDIDWLSDVPLQITYNDSMQPVLDILSKDFELVLLSDYPAAWGERIITTSYFADYLDRIVFTAQAGPHADYETFCTQLVQSDIMQPGSSALVDWHSLRTRAALNAGLDAAIFTDAARFYRDLGLWGIVPLLDINTIRNSSMFTMNYT